MTRSLLPIRLPACILCLCLGACGPSPGKAGDLLDPNALEDIGEDEGDATGSRWSGRYESKLHRTSCDCPPLPVLDDGAGPTEQQEISLCSIDELQGTRDTLLVQQADGYLSIELYDQLTGPIQVDGSFSVAGVRDDSTAFFHLRALSRIDGTFSEGPTGKIIDGVYGQRMTGTLANEDVDCRANFDLRGVWSEPE